jgi:hypothetical protein
MVDGRGRSTEERAALRAKIDKLNAEARDNWDNPAWRKMMAQETTETIMWGFEHENLLSMMTTVENAPFDGRVLVKETRGLRAFWVARGGYIESSTIHSEVMEMPRDTIGFHVYEFEDKLRVNFAETQTTLIDLAQQRMDAEVNLRVIRGFQAAIPSTSSSYITGAGLSLAALNTAIRGVADATYEQGSIAIVGRRTMLDQIMDQLTGPNTFGGFIPQTNEDILRRGILGTYRGANLIQLKNFKDDVDVPFFPANELYVLGVDASKFAFFGGLLSKEWSEEENWYWHYLARRDCGMVIHRPERARRIVDTSISPTAGSGGGEWTLP